MLFNKDETTEIFYLADEFCTEFSKTVHLVVRLATRLSISIRKRDLGINELGMVKLPVLPTF